MNLELLTGFEPRGAHLSELRLLQYEAGELEGAPLEAVTAHLEACPECAARLKARAGDRDVFLLQRPLPTFLAQLEAKRQARAPWWRRWSRGGAWGGLGLLAAAAALVIALRPAPPPPAPLEPSTRLKAAVGLSFHVKSGPIIRLGRDGEQLYPGDQIQLRISTPKPTHLVVLSLDSSGAVTPFYDDEGWTLEMKAGVAQLLEGSVVLDEVLGAERVIGCFCEAPMETQVILDAASEAFEAAGREPRRVGRLDLPCAQASFLLHKVEE